VDLAALVEVLKAIVPHQLVRHQLFTFLKLLLY